MILETEGLLVAGVGNFFLGDDGFGAAVIEGLRMRPLPRHVRLVDFGTRAFDLALALERVAGAIVVDAVSRGGAPGTLYVLEPELAAGRAVAIDGHALKPEAVLAALPAAARPRFLRIVGCEPETFGPADVGRVGLSEAVRASLDEAVALVEALISASHEHGVGRCTS